MKVIYIQEAFQFWKFHMACGWHVGYPKIYLAQYDNLASNFYIVYHIEFVMFLEIPCIEIPS